MILCLGACGTWLGLPSGVVLPESRDFTALLVRLCDLWQRPWLDVGTQPAYLFPEVGDVYGLAAQHPAVRKNSASRCLGAILFSLLRFPGGFNPVASHVIQVSKPVHEWGGKGRLAFIRPWPAGRPAAR